MVVPVPASVFRWESSPVAPFTILSTEINGLVISSGNALSKLGAAFSNTNVRIYCDIEFSNTIAFSPTGGFIEVWLLRSLDAGLGRSFSTGFSSGFGGLVTTEDGGPNSAPGRAADCVLPVRSGTSILTRSTKNGVVLPPSIYNPIARNQTGTTLPATGSTIRLMPYSMAR